jgi:hypothetical protein
MKRGLYLAPFDELADPRLLAELATVAESRGWDGLFLWDRIAYPPSDRAVADPWVALSAIASMTDSLRIGPMITPLSRRRVQKVARETASLATVFVIVGGGAMVLGFGPFATQAAPQACVVGLLAMIAGAMLITSAVGLLLRTRWARAAGLAGSCIVALLGLAVGGAGVDALLLRCRPGLTDAPSPCLGLGAIALVGFLLLLTGVAGIRVVARTRRSYFAPRRSRRSGRLR